MGPILTVKIEMWTQSSTVHTVDSEEGGFTGTSTGHVLGDTRVVASIAQSHLTNDEVSFIRDDQIDVFVGIDWLVVF